MGTKNWVLTLPLAALALAGCAFKPVVPGMSQEEVMAIYGKPTRSVPLEAGTRLQYSRQSFGQSAVMVDLDAAGKVVSAREAMVRSEFARVRVGQWTRADVEREFGPPASTDRVGDWSGDVMNYRWLDINQGMFFWVYLDGGQVVRRVGQGMEFPMRPGDND